MELDRSTCLRVALPLFVLVYSFKLSGRYSSQTILWHPCTHPGVGASGACWASGRLSRGFRRLVALTPVVFWTASVEPACWHPTAFLTTIAFYGSDSGPLWGSDLAVFSFVRRSSCLSSLPLSTGPPQQEPHVPISAGPIGTA